MAPSARSMVLRVKKNLYIEAAVVNGTKTWKILLVHVLPNMVTQMVVTAAADIGTMMLELASLSFLGFGATAPTPEWGLMLKLQDRLHMCLDFFSVFQMSGIFYITYYCNKRMSGIKMIHVFPSYILSI